MPPLFPLQVGGLVLFGLFGLVFAGLGLPDVVRPRAMTAYAIRQRAGGEIEGHVEPTATRLLFTRVMGGVMVLVGTWLAAGFLGP